MKASLLFAISRGSSKRGELELRALSSELAGTGSSIRTRRQLPMPSRQNEKAISGPKERDYLHCKEAILSCVISLISESLNVQLVVRTSRGMFPS